MTVTRSRAARRRVLLSLAGAVLAGSVLAAPAGAANGSFNGMTCGIDLEPTPLAPTTYRGTASMGPWAVGVDGNITLGCRLLTTADYDAPAIWTWSETFGPGRAFPPRASQVVVSIADSPPYYLCTRARWGSNGSEAYDLCEPVTAAGSPPTLSKPPTAANRGTVNTLGAITVHGNGPAGGAPVYTLSGVLAPELDLWTCHGDNDGGDGPVTVECVPRPRPVFQWGCHTIVAGVAIVAPGGRAQTTASCGYGTAPPYEVSTQPCFAYPCADEEALVLEVPTDVIRCVVWGVVRALPYEPYTATCGDPPLIRR